MEDELIDAVLRGLLEEEDVEDWLRVGRIVEEELAHAVDDLDIEDDFVDNDVLDDVLLRKLLGEFVVDDDLVSVVLEERDEVEDEEDDLEMRDDSVDVGDELIEEDSRDVVVDVREEVIERDVETELVDVCVLNEDQVQ